MKKILGAMAILVAMGMGFVGCVPEAATPDGNKTDNNGSNSSNDNLPQKELPASVGENPFKGNTYVSTNDGSYTFTENEATFKRHSEPTVYSYAYDTQKNLLALKVSKIQSSINPADLVTPEQYINEQIGIMADEKQFRAWLEQMMNGGEPVTDEVWQVYLNSQKEQFSLPETASYEEFINAYKFRIQNSMPMNSYYSYYFDGSSLKLKDYVNPELTLKQYYTDYAIPSFSYYDNESGKSLSVSGTSLNDGSLNYRIVDVTDTVIKVKDAASTTLDIPYTMTAESSPKLTITVDNKDYTLSTREYWSTYTKQ